MADTSGPNSTRLVASAQAPSIVQHSKCLPSALGPRPSGQKWSQLKTMSAPGFLRCGACPADLRVLGVLGLYLHADAYRPLGITSHRAAAPPRRGQGCECTSDVRTLPQPGTSSIGRRYRGPQAEPLLGAVVLLPLYLSFLSPKWQLARGSSAVS